jgi:8-amino-7-oxononanoate synthase
MSTGRYASLEQYAWRRFTLSGSAVKDHYPYCQTMEKLHVGTADDPIAEVTSFAHYDYLSLASDPRIRDAAKQAIDDVGVGAGASRLVGGERSTHRDLEGEFAEFIGVDDTLALVSGYGTNVTLVSHLLSKGDLIIVDESSHNSIMAHRRDYARVLVVVEGLYSMDGDVPDLPALIPLCRSHGAWLMIDEAHSIGVLGKSGRGVAEHFGIPASEIDLIVGTLSKAFVTCGGFIGGRQGVIDWLRFTLPGFVYSVGMPPPSAAAARCALRLLQAEPERLRRLHDNSRYFVDGARARGLNTGTAVGAAVIPIMFSSTPIAIGAGNAALQAGYFVPPIVQIAVPKDLPRLRFFLTAGHDRRQIDGVLDALSPFIVESPAESADDREAPSRPARGAAL